jgi:hypothetical protein
MFTRSFWIVVPSLVTYQLGKDLLGSLRLADAMNGKGPANGATRGSAKVKRS